MDILTRRLLQTVWAECREIIGIIKYSQLVTEIFLPFLGLMRQEEKTIMNEKEREVERATSQGLQSSADR